MYTRMVIGEANSDEQALQLAKEFDFQVKEMLVHTPGFVSAQVLIEEDGRMVVLTATWETREQCIAYYASRTYRIFVMKCNHLLIGYLVIKMFHLHGQTVKAV